MYPVRKPTPVVCVEEFAVFSLVSLFGAYDTVEVWCADFVCNVFPDNVIIDLVYDGVDEGLHFVVVSCVV